MLRRSTIKRIPATINSRTVLPTQGPYHHPWLDLPGPCLHGWICRQAWVQAGRQRQRRRRFPRTISLLLYTIVSSSRFGQILCSCVRHYSSEQDSAGSLASLYGSFRLICIIFGSSFWADETVSIAGAGAAAGAPMDLLLCTL